MDGANVQVDNGNVIYRASALGSCTKALVAARLGYEPLGVPEKLQGIFAAGQEYEERTISQLRSEDWHVYDEQLEVTLEVSSRLSVVGHIDGKILVKGDQKSEGGVPHILEIKSQSQDAWDTWKDDWSVGFFPKYKWQVSSYMLATGMPLCLVRVLREDNKDGSDQSLHPTNPVVPSITKYDVSFVDEPFYTRQDISTRVLWIEGTARSGELPRLCDRSDFPCPYSYLHEELEPIEDEDLEKLCRQYDEGKLWEKISKEKKDTAKRAIVSHMGEEKKIETSGGYKVTRYEQKNPPRLDRDKMAEDGVEVEKYLVYSTGERLRVTVPKEDEDAEGQ